MREEEKTKKKEGQIKENNKKRFIQVCNAFNLYFM